MTKVGFVFDDGFSASCLKIADIYEARGLHATFAVLVDHTGFMPAFPKGDFSLWRELQTRGHVIHPHGYDHSDLSRISYSEAINKIDACLAHFSDNLPGFLPQRTVYHATYNRTTPEVDAYLLSRFGAVRSNGVEGQVGHGFNYCEDLKKRILICSWHGPDHCDTHLIDMLHLAEHEQPELFLYMMHGVDHEGWGPVNAETLQCALDFILASPRMRYSDLSELSRD